MKLNETSHIPHPTHHIKLDSRDVLIVLALIAATIVLYRPSLTAEFVSLDDYMYVVDNESVRNPSIKSVKRFFGEVLHPTTVDGYYQPLAMLSLMFDAWLTGGDGLDPFYYHLTNILLHGMAGGLVYLLMRALFDSRIAAAIAAMLFLFHPVQVESVAWISQRKSVLATCFALAGVLAYVRYARIGRIAWLCICAALMALGNLAKPIVMPLPIVLILLDFWPLRRPILKSLPEKLIFAPIVAASAFVAWASQSSTAMLGAPKFESFEMATKWVGLLSYNFMLYLGNLLWPVFLSPYRTIPTDLSWTNPAIACSIVATAALGAITIASLRRSTGLFVGMGGFVILLSPGLGGVHFAATCVGDRFLYLPLVLLLLPLTAALVIKPLNESMAPKSLTSTLHRLAKPRIVVAFILLTLCTWMTVRQQSVWASSRNMWFHIQAAAPDFANANHNVAIILLDERQPKEAIEYARRAARTKPDNAAMRLALGRAFTLTGRPDEGVAQINEAIRLGLNRQQGYGYIALAEAAMVQGDTQAARNYIARADELGWKNPQSVILIADAAFEFAHDCDASIEFYRMAISRVPDNANMIYGLANRLRNCGRPEEALLEYERFVGIARRQGVDVSAVESAMEHLRTTLGATAPADQDSQIMHPKP